MPTLLESLQPQLGGTPTPLPQTQLGQTQGLRNLVQASSGRAAVPGEQPKQADVGELEAAHETKLQGQQQALSEQINTAGVQGKSADITAQQQEQQNTIGENVKNNQAQFEIRSNSIISDYTNNQRKIATQRDVMNLEQAGAAIRLSNQQYVAALQRQGDMARLNNDAAFKQAAYQSEFNSGIILTNDKVQFDQMMNADDRTFAWAMGQMDIDYAIQVADQARKQANAQATFQGVGGIMSAGAGAFSSQQAAGWFKSTPGTTGIDENGDQATSSSKIPR